MREVSVIMPKNHPGNFGHGEMGMNEMTMEISGLRHKIKLCIFVWVLTISVSVFVICINIFSKYSQENTQGDTSFPENIFQNVLFL